MHPVNDASAPAGPKARLPNAPGATVRCEVRLFNSLARRAPGAGASQPLRVPVGTTVADLMARFDVPASEVFLVLVNGHDISRGLYGHIRTDYYIQDGDSIALSGPVPYSWGYGAPIV